MRWYVFRVKSGTDFAVVERLMLLGLQVVCPFGTRRVRHRRNKTMLTKYFPILSGYVFIRLRPQDFVFIEQITDIGGVLRNRSTMNPEPVADDIVEMLQSAQDKGVFEQGKAIAKFAVGDPVSFDLFGTVLDAVVSKVSGGLVTAKSELGGKPVVVTRPENNFGALSA